MIQVFFMFPEGISGIPNGKFNILSMKSKHPTTEVPSLKLT